MTHDTREGLRPGALQVNRGFTVDAFPGTPFPPWKSGQCDVNVTPVLCGRLSMRHSEHASTFYSGDWAANIRSSSLVSGYCSSMVRTSSMNMCWTKWPHFRHGGCFLGAWGKIFGEVDDVSSGLTAHFCPPGLTRDRCPNLPPQKRKRDTFGILLHSALECATGCICDFHVCGRVWSMSLSFFIKA